MHSTSEHTLDDYHYDAEIHFVHKNTDTGTILVTGVLLHAEPGVEENSFIKSTQHFCSTHAHQNLHLEGCLS